MKHDQRQTRAILDTIARSDARSPLFWWMVEHHDEIIAAAAGQRIRWGSFCAEAARIGLTDTRGQPATERNARETWHQARRMVERARLPLTAAPTAPSASSRSASAPQSPLVPPPPTRPPATDAAAPTRVGSHILGRKDCLSPEEVQAEIDKVSAQLAEWDRKRFPFGG